MIVGRAWVQHATRRYTAVQPESEMRAIMIGGPQVAVQLYPFRRNNDPPLLPLPTTLPGSSDKIAIVTCMLWVYRPVTREAVSIPRASRPASQSG